MKEATDEENPSLAQPNGGSLRAHAVPMAIFVRNLTRLTRRPVTDETGLKGRYDFTITWTPDLNQPMNEKEMSTPADALGPTIYTALQERLGLKLESRKTQIETLVIDRAEKASEN